MKIINTPKICSKISNFQKSLHKLTASSSECKNYKFPKFRLPCEIIQQIKYKNSCYNDFLNKKGKITKEEYFDILTNNPSYITRSYKVCDNITEIKTRPETMAKIAVNLKNQYDKLYNNNYTIISIGTSPSPITEIMSNIGADVIHLPASNFRFFEDSKSYILKHKYPTIASRHKNIGILMDYLSKKGIGDKKNAIILPIDYIASGKTLETIAEIIKQRGDIDPKKVKPHSINKDVLNMVLNGKAKDITYEEARRFENELNRSKYQKITNVPHFSCDFRDTEVDKYTVSSDEKTIWEIFKQFDEFSQPTARAWNLCATHEAMQIINKNNIS